MDKAHKPDWSAQRLDCNPLITPISHPLAGTNIQGPSAIEVPSWVPNALGNYYLYFADHKGDRIGLAYADRISGPWRIFNPGALTLKDSTFPEHRLPHEGMLVPERADWAPAGTPGSHSVLEEAVTPHIASPDVHVDNAARIIRMYFHGLESFNVQRTRLAISSDGLSFRTITGSLGKTYFRVFQYREWIYSLVMPGRLVRSASWEGPFEEGPDLFNDARQRHTAVLVEGDTLWVFWTRVTDAPERILCSRVRLGQDWREWRVEDTFELLRPQYPWEGADLPVQPSWRSAVTVRVNQLRDPAILRTKMGLWLFYALAGEAGIGVCELLAPEISDTSRTR